MLAVDELLTRTSRTFALAIPLLPEPTRRNVALAYLLFRVADTLEDGENWSPGRRIEALADFSSELRAPSDRARELARAWTQVPPTGHEGYRALLAAFPELLSEVLELGDEPRRIIVSHALRTADGMSATLARTDAAGTLALADLPALRAYCYVVAGIVGELLTALFLHDAPGLDRVRDVLLEHQAAFGEGLQLVNVLKDQSSDALAGRTFLPPGVARADVLALARQDLECAALYINALGRAGAPSGFVAFTALSATLAEATLRTLEERGPGTKLTRDQVQRFYAEHAAMARGGDPTPGPLPHHSARLQSGK
jgi:farnesyl-diphosphate farnesyltransferase